MRRPGWFAVGLAIAFPLWNTNSLIGILWGRLLFGELKGASTSNVLKVVLGTILIVAAAIMLGFSTMHGGGSHPTHALNGILAALGASLLWGSMYIPYRKAYLSGEAAGEFAGTLQGKAPFIVAGTLDRAIELAANDAAGSDAKEPVVLLSPACASYDQYRNFEIRGAAFRDLVTALPGVKPVV